jgi:thiamine-monophosphate kinase
MQQECLLYGGDDYELLFSAAPARSGAVRAAAQRCGVPVSMIGRIEAQPGLVVLDAEGRALALRAGGFDHFKT